MEKRPLLRQETVLSVHHWTDRLFSFTTTRDASFRFANGQFTMVGLPVNGKPLLRAYSMASANHEEHLEFFSIKVAEGPLTSRLQHLKAGDPVLVSDKPTGTLVLDNLAPGKRLYLLSTGTGLAPFLSLVKDPEVYECFEAVILVHGVRFIADLAYRDRILEDLPKNAYLGEIIAKGLRYYPTVTREPFRNHGRITQLIANNGMTDSLGFPPLSPAEDRVMLCGSELALADLTQLLDSLGFAQGSADEPGGYVIEKAFAEK